MAIRDAPVVDWSGRFEQFVSDEASLDAGELDEFGQAAWFVGRDDVSERAWERAQLRYLDDGDLVAAARCIFWLGFTLGEHGEMIKANTWTARLFELCARGAGDPRVDVFPALLRAHGAFTSGDVAASEPMYAAAAALAEAAGDVDLDTLATMGHGRALVTLGRFTEGVAAFDRIMLRISTGQVSDRAAGPAYCAVIASLLARGDLERARVWTRDLGEWCDAQRGLEPFRGECTLHRATVMQIGGEWDAAVQAADHVCATDTRTDTLANAWYRLAELHRVAGRAAAARDGFRRASQLGRDVQPGLALLHRDAGELDTAWAGLERARATGSPPATQAELLAAAVQVGLDRHRIADAEAACTELDGCADASGALYLQALAARAAGELAVAQRRTADALELLRRAWVLWRRLDAPYDAALTRVAIGCAARQAGDEEGAQLEFDAARTVLDGLGAVPDLARLERAAAASGPAPAVAGLSRREREVLELVARGWSNRRIAEHLFLSERTVARHVGSILAKLDVPSRSAATAYAYAHGLAQTP